MFTETQGYGVCLRLLPGTLLVDAYLKYLAWALSDRDATVRCAALDALRQLYGQPGAPEAMVEFTRRCGGGWLRLSVE